LGEHNAAVLGGLLGYDEARIAQLRAAGVLVSGERRWRAGARVRLPDEGGRAEGVM
jgi:hypothetical protein